MAEIFVSHSSRDDLTAEALRIWLSERFGEAEIFVDHAITGIRADERWKQSLAEANGSANALICVVTPDWLDSKESQVERRVFETLRDLDPYRRRAIILAIIRDTTRADMRERGFGEAQLIELTGGGSRQVSVRAELPGGPDEPGRIDTIHFTEQGLDQIERSLREIGVAPDSFPWQPRDPADPSPYPGLAAFTEDDAGVFFGRDGEIARALTAIEDMRTAPNGSRLFTVLAASGAGKSSFLRAGLWPRLNRRPETKPLVVLRPGVGLLSGEQGGFKYALANWYRRAGRSVDWAHIHAHFAGRTIEEGLRSALTEVAGEIGPGKLLVIGIDQAEELFATIGPARETEARDGLAALLNIVANPDGAPDLALAFAIRSDSRDPLGAAFVESRERAERNGWPRRLALDSTVFELDPMPDSAYREVVAGPARVARKTQSAVFEPQLIDELVRTFDGADALPLLAMTLKQLYGAHIQRDLITLADYTAFYDGLPGAEGPVRRALATAYEVAGSAGTDDNLRALLIPALATWDPAAGEAGAEKRRIALRADVVAGDPGRARLADALVHADVRLLTQGTSTDGPTLEIAHEALLRIEPVRDWVMDEAANLRLRDELVAEAAAWHRARGAGDAQAERAAVDGRRGLRLEAATDLLALAQFADLSRADAPVADFVAACQAHETAERDRQRRIIGRAFVKPSQKALEDGASEHALRLAASGVLLARDTDFDPKVDTQLREPAVRAIFENRTRAVLHGHTGPANTTAFSPDGTGIVTASDDTTARIWDAATGDLIAPLEGHSDELSSAAFSPDGTRIVTASSDNTARIWDAATAHLIARLEGHTHVVTSATFSPDGTRIVTASLDKTARVWNAVAGPHISTLASHSAAVLYAAFSPDGSLIITTSSDQTAWIWNAVTRQLITSLEGHTRGVNSAAFSPDGTRVVTASRDNTARIWDVSRTAILTKTPGVVLAAALARGVGQRTAAEAADLLMQDAPQDLFAETLRQIGRTPDDPEIQKVIDALAKPLHRNCYLAPSALAATFGAKPAATAPPDPAHEQAPSDSPWHTSAAPPPPRRWWQWPREAEKHGQRAAITKALANLPAIAPIRSLVGSQAFEDHLAAYEASNAKAVNAQTAYKRWAGFALVLATFATVLAAGTLLPVSALLPAAADRAVSGFQAAANILSLAVVWWLGRAGAIDAWLTRRAETERLRGALFADLVAAPAPPGADIKRLWREKLALFNTAHVDYQRTYFKSAAKRHTQAAGGLSVPRALATFAIVLSIVVGAVAALDGWPTFLQTLAPWLKLAEEPVRWQLGLGTLASALLAYASARTLIHQDERNAALYTHTRTRLDDLVAARGPATEAAASDGDSDAVTAFVNDAQAILDADYTAWQFHRPPADPTVGPAT